MERIHQDSPNNHKSEAVGLFKVPGTQVDIEAEGLLRRTMDYAEDGEHGAAFDALTEARIAGAPRDLVKKAEGYLAHLRDGSI